MTEIDLIADIKKKYDFSNLNEASTRFYIIDELLEKLLKWPKSRISVEQHVDGNYTDYILLNPQNKPLLVIESKKTGKYFELPANLNANKKYQKISIDKLLSDENIKSAILQVKEYCEDLVCNYGAITNGDVWIIFKVTPTNQKPWKKLPAFVIKNLDFFVNDYTTAINILGYTNVTEQNSIQNNIGVSKKNYSEVFFPKHKIIAYDTLVTTNFYSGPFSAISRKFLGPIPIHDAEFMDKCYVTNKGQYDKLQKNVHGFLHDSLTPYFLNQGFRDFTVDNNGGAFGTNIVKTIKQENLDNVMILFGGRGSGKSTFLKRFLFHVKPKEINIYSEVSLVDLIDASQTTEQLSNEIWEKVRNTIDTTNIRNGSRDEIIDLFKEEFAIYKKQILLGLAEESEEYQKLLRDFLLKNLNDTKLFCEKISTKLKNKNKGLIIFLDNMDQLNPDLQELCYLTAIEIAKKLSCLVIISMREERYYNAKIKGALDAYHTPGFHLAAPIIPEVLIKRIIYILRKLDACNDIDLEYGIKSKEDLETIKSFLKICIFQLKKNDSHISLFLRYATHGDVRQALEFLKSFLSSGYTNVLEIAQYPYWTFSIHQVIKPMMIPDRIFYDESLSRIPNIFRLRNDVNSSHFTGMRILNLLSQKMSANANGFVDSKIFLQEFVEKYQLIEDCELNLDIFIRNGLVECSNRLEEFSKEVDSIKITALGLYILESLSYSFAYIDLISIDSGVFIEEFSNYLSVSANDEINLKNQNKILDRMQLRIERAEQFIKYLEEQENEEFEHLNLNISEIHFTEKLRKSFSEEKSRILESAKKNQ
ncbi:P-loop NTPase fold protein [Flavobacterium adhaerens]|uniref:P-loop NTPase fold protein n=1 Tax=Flavobacterium adhaerens TaxID=3149043 RepID=UPI0032B31FC5